MNSGKFRLPGKKHLTHNADNWSVVVVDATERPIERPKKTAFLLQWKKKQHTLKVEVVVDGATGQIICTAFSKGRVHDFRLFKRHRLPMLPQQLCLADKGYQGIALVTFKQLHPNKKTSESKT